jgi:hypothetical protein
MIPAHCRTTRGTRQSRDKAKDVLFVASLVDVVSIAKDKERTSRRKDDEKTKILVLYLVWILFLFGLVLCLFEMVLNKGRNFCQPSPLGLLEQAEKRQVKGVHKIGVLLFG